MKTIRFKSIDFFFLTKNNRQEGIVFIDEIDKLCNKNGSFHGADASAEGVQRDLLPIIEGCDVSTRYGNVKTDHVLFICSGAFHSVKPRDLLAELQGTPANMLHFIFHIDEKRIFVFEPSKRFISRLTNFIRIHFSMFGTGRLPVRVSLQPLTINDFVRILQEPKHNLIYQNKEMLKTEDGGLGPAQAPAAERRRQRKNRAAGGMGRMCDAGPG